MKSQISSIFSRFHFQTVTEIENSFDSNNITYFVTKECSIVCRSDRRTNKIERVIVAHTKRILMIQCYSKSGESGNRFLFRVHSRFRLCFTENKIFEYRDTVLCLSVGYTTDTDRIGYAAECCTVAKAVQCSMFDLYQMKTENGKISDKTESAIP